MYGEEWSRRMYLYKIESNAVPNAFDARTELKILLDQPYLIISHWFFPPEAAHWFIGTTWNPIIPF